MSRRPPLRVAVLGAGTVGGAVLRAFLERPERLCPDDGSPLVLAGVAVRDLARPRPFPIPAEVLTDAPAHLVASPDVDVVVECMGGDEPARTLIAAALGAGKPVVTANKHVVAHHGPELEAIARRSRSALRFEAAVGGGIPVLTPLGADLASNSVARIRGIVNGTTNFILTAMARDGRTYEEALAAAQAAGYAEADPGGDVEGADAANKLVILARLAFGEWVRPEAVVVCPPTLGGLGRPGITGVTLAEIEGAAALGLAIKLVANAEAGSVSPGTEEGVRSEPDLRLSVLPTAVPLEDPLGRTDGVTNRIEVHAQPLGVIAFSGPGAGGEATASAILGDLLALARGGGSTWAGLPPVRLDRAVAPGPPVEHVQSRGWFALVPTEAAKPRAGRNVPNGVRMAEVAGRPGDPLRDLLARRGEDTGRLVRRTGRSPALSRRRVGVCVMSGVAGARPTLVERYRAFLPVSETTPTLSLGEGFTPLVRLRHIGARGRPGEPLRQGRGPEPDGQLQGPRDGGRGVEGARRGRQVDHLRLDGQHVRLRRGIRRCGRPRGGRRPPEGPDRAGKLLQALVAGARVVAVDGNFDQALSIVRELAEQPGHPITLVNSVNPYRLEGQKTAAFEVCDDLGRAPDILAIPVGNAGNISAYWAGFRDYERAGTIAALPRMFGFQAAGAAPIVLDRVIEAPETFATAIRIGNPASWQKAVRARDESGGLIEAVTDDEILAAYRDLVRFEGVFCEPSSAASIAGIRKLAQAGRLEPGATVVCVLTGNGLKDPHTAESVVRTDPRGVAHDRGRRSAARLVSA